VHEEILSTLACMCMYIGATYRMEDVEYLLTVWELVLRTQLFYTPGDMSQEHHVIPSTEVT
jgi:hypothetical protein